MALYFSLQNFYWRYNEYIQFINVREGQVQDSNNLKNYISGITKSKALDEKVLFVITIVLQ